MLKATRSIFNYRIIRKKDALEILDELVNEGWAEYHWNGECVSLRSSEKVEVREFLKENSEMKEWMLESLF